MHGEKLSYQVCTEALDEMDKAIEGEKGNCTEMTLCALLWGHICDLICENGSSTHIKFIWTSTIHYLRCAKAMNLKFAHFRVPT